MAKPEKKLGLRTRLGYSAGHVLSDMISSLLPSYGLLFYQNVIQLEVTFTGLIFLIAQIADSLSTILVGIFSDVDVNCWIYKNYGKRKAR